MTYTILLLTPLVMIAGFAEPLFAGAGKHHAGTPEQLKPLAGLAGTWKGTSQEGKPAKAVYRLTSGGTSVEETLTMGDEPAMTTMYHADGDRLMATHYCSLGNQPRLKASSVAPDAKTVSFAFVDATNLKSLDDPHISRVQFDLQDKNHITQVWGWSEKGKEKELTLRLERAK